MIWSETKLSISTFTLGLGSALIRRFILCNWKSSSNYSSLHTWNIILSVCLSSLSPRISIFSLCISSILVYWTSSSNHLSLSTNIYISHFASPPLFGLFVDLGARYDKGRLCVCLASAAVARAVLERVLLIASKPFFYLFLSVSLWVFCLFDCFSFPFSYFFTLLEILLLAFILRLFEWLYHSFLFFRSALTGVQILIALRIYLLCKQVQMFFIWVASVSKYFYQEIDKNFDS